MTSPGPEGAARDAGAELADALMRAARGLRRGWHAGLEPSGLSPHQARALHVLGGGRGHRLATPQVAGPDGGPGGDGGMRVSELAAALRIAPRSATEVVDGLVDKGLAERGDDPADRRAVVVRLTGAGTSALAAAERARARAAGELFGRLDDDERTELTRLLRRLAD